MKLEEKKVEYIMKHICNATANGYTFGISICSSLDIAGMLRIVDENDGTEILDMLENEADAINAIFSMFPDNNW